MPFSARDKLPDILDALEDMKNDENIDCDSYGLAVANLEEVFLKIAKGEHNKEDLESKVSTMLLQKKTDSVLSRNIGDTKFDPTRVPTKWAQFKSMFYRRIRIGARSKVVTILGICVPCFLLIVAAFTHRLVYGNPDGNSFDATTSVDKVFGALMLGGMIITVSVAFLTVASADFSVMERGSGIKDFLFINGCAYVPYWSSNLLWDVLAAIPWYIILIIFWSIPWFTFHDVLIPQLGWFTVMFGLFVFSSAFFAYILSQVLKTQWKSVIICLLFNGLATYICATIYISNLQQDIIQNTSRNPPDRSKAFQIIADIVDVCGFFFPTYALVSFIFRGGLRAFCWATISQLFTEPYMTKRVVPYSYVRFYNAIAGTNYTPGYPDLDAPTQHFIWSPTSQLYEYDDLIDDQPPYNCSIGDCPPANESASSYNLSLYYGNWSSLFDGFSNESSLSGGRDVSGFGGLTNSPANPNVTDHSTRNNLTSFLQQYTDAYGVTNLAIYNQATIANSAVMSRSLKKELNQSALVQSSNQSWGDPNNLKAPPSLTTSFVHYKAKVHVPATISDPSLMPATSFAETSFSDLSSIPVSLSDLSLSDFEDLANSLFGDDALAEANGENNLGTGVSDATGNVSVGNVSAENASNASDVTVSDFDYGVACSGDADCTSSLRCVSGTCLLAETCADNDDCTVSPFTNCDTDRGICVDPNNHNGTEGYWWTNPLMWCSAEAGITYRYAQRMKMSPFTFQYEVGNAWPDMMSKPNSTKVVYDTGANLQEPDAITGDVLNNALYRTNSADKVAPQNETQFLYQYWTSEQQEKMVTCLSQFTNVEKKLSSFLSKSCQKSSNEISSLSAKSCPKSINTVKFSCSYRNCFRLRFSVLSRRAAVSIVLTRIILRSLRLARIHISMILSSSCSYRTSKRGSTN